ncbi:polyprenyl synthetase family protein [Mucilaginibacter agri]|uniref:Polyprenyl synthetase superfamily n=1 Tax=Mucilaginibacter agri TaxID=2695265 RepID=A0A965ZIF6_9SPHI|nr:polyprenyl synthetase family protein [Mucilaginibacter agri]NCD71688.1 polyprenyl synthetase superfamily [Mucilaginibacter agri]
MEWFDNSLILVKNKLYEAVPNNWGEMHIIAQNYFKRDVIPELLVPITCCKAVGGNPEEVPHVFSAIAAASISARILDDIQDQDKSDAVHLKVGVARAVNYVDTFRTLAFKLIGQMFQITNKSQQIYNLFIESYFDVLKAQENELKGNYSNWLEAMKTSEMKSGYVYGAISYLGASIGTDNEDYIKACKKYGYHFGIAVQLFNDMDGIWNTDESSDLDQNKVTLPLLYGLNCDHEWKEELSNIVKQNTIAANKERIKEILDHIDTKRYLVWAALQERDKALNAISILENNSGVEVLEAHFTGMFGDIDDLMNGYELDNHNPLTETSNADTDNSYRSEALNIRSKLSEKF